ncbi:phosphotransferase family protein [Artomyces pyxidatus]|uniref:Phosphotransferase family protein n=1 Tax=Artomyces pyxidatus TaxID=48021 RepID=A0ACB8SJK6_9AGAM|nr:phosphotransferase family protein [Artomyces pyxidatus]
MSNPGSGTEVSATTPVRVKPKREEGCIAITHEKKYYEIDGAGGTVFVKRSLSRDEWLVNMKGETVVPRITMERLRNKVAAIAFVRRNTQVPVPTVRAAFEDRGCYYIIMDTIPGVVMRDIPPEKKPALVEEAARYMATLHETKSDVMGGFAGVACLPYRLDVAVPHDDPLEFGKAGLHEFVLCHNDLSQNNIIVDPETFKINGIIDWEYAGFYPREFDGAFYNRPGPSTALEGEENDVRRLLEILDECRRK